MLADGEVHLRELQELPDLVEDSLTCRSSSGRRFGSANTRPCRSRVYPTIPSASTRSPPVESGT